MSETRPVNSLFTRQPTDVADVHEVDVQAVGKRCADGVKSAPPAVLNHAPCSAMMAGASGTLVGVTEVSTGAGRRWKWSPGGDGMAEVVVIGRFAGKRFDVKLQQRRRHSKLTPARKLQTRLGTAKLLQELIY